MWAAYELHHGSPGGTTQDSIVNKVEVFDVSNLLSLLRAMPKEIFITQVLQDSSSDGDRLDRSRMDILDCIKQTDGYPFDSRTSLKKRIQTRTGDSVV